ncbi:MAG: hypothetical protein JSV41_13000 [Gemmatimonadota bacterium]|nr:MAG: hypothetical protein JSV41_13000 [Gemmatimonadota bacterium]
MPIDRQRILSSKAQAPLALILGFLIRLGYRSSWAWMAYLSPEHPAAGSSSAREFTRVAR